MCSWRLIWWDQSGSGNCSEQVDSLCACPGFLLEKTRPWRGRGWYATRPCFRLGHCGHGSCQFYNSDNSGKCAHVDLVSLMYNLLNKCDREQNPVFGPQRKPEVLLICMLNAFSMFDTWFLLTENFSNCLSVFYSWEFTPSHSKYTRQNMQQI